MSSESSVARTGTEGASVGTESKRVEKVCSACIDNSQPELELRMHDSPRHSLSSISITDD